VELARFKLRTNLSVASEKFQVLTPHLFGFMPPAPGKIVSCAPLQAMNHAAEPLLVANIEEPIISPISALGTSSEIVRFGAWVD
jgi:hypothetical protein